MVNVPEANVPDAQMLSEILNLNSVIARLQCESKLLKEINSQMEARINDQSMIIKLLNEDNLRLRRGDYVRVDSRGPHEVHMNVKDADSGGKKTKKPASKRHSRSSAANDMGHADPEHSESKQPQTPVLQMTENKRNETEDQSRMSQCADAIEVNRSTNANRGENELPRQTVTVAVSKREDVSVVTQTKNDGLQFVTVTDKNENVSQVREHYAVDAEEEAGATDIDGDGGRGSAGDGGDSRETTVAHGHDEGGGNWRVAQSRRVRRGSKPRPDFAVVGRASGKFSIAAVPRRASIYVSRIQPGTSVDDMKHFLGDDFPGVDCELMQSKHPNQYSSFRVYLNCEDVNRALDPNRWPVGVFVNKFFMRRQNLGKIS